MENLGRQWSEPLRIGIDAGVLEAQNGGDASYVRGLVQALPNVDQDNDYYLFVNRALPPGVVPDSGRLKVVPINAHPPQLYMPLYLPLALARKRLDLVHVQYIAPPYPIPIVVTVHDISYERYPQFFPPSMLMQWRIGVPLTIRRAAVVLTVSEYSRQDMVRRYCVDPDKVIVIPPGPQRLFQVRSEAPYREAIRQRYSQGRRYILFVGNLQPRKNLKTLVEAYVRLRRGGTIDQVLVIVGQEGWLANEIFASVLNSGYKDSLLFTGYVTDDDLLGLYNAADLFVYPSIFEGFGLPPVEAMACGTPVITSNTSSLPEVVGDAAVMIDPLDVDALTQAIARVLMDTQLQETLTARGLRRAALFAWDNNARAIRQVYERVAERGREKTAAKRH